MKSQEPGFFGWLFIFLWTVLWVFFLENIEVFKRAKRKKVD